MMDLASNPWLVLSALTVTDTRASDPPPTPERAAAELAYQTGMLRAMIRLSPLPVAPFGAAAGDDRSGAT